MENFSGFSSDSLEDDYNSIIGELDADKTENQLKEKEKFTEYSRVDNFSDF
ncbi:MULTISPECIES: hypothetical protein [Okeania]|uniref:hypothetical protein n=1 Tax=Okeania TaxID=1458928 RepID=UPI0013752EF4|nr:MULTISPECIES: hypothetical protein [Okeania]NEP07722.1 hypothetical protein [Okeania sp. SIO4D6]NEP41893.1 hypothetical protein [Okeania sp. SIO2H7]NET12381.1 hypothetical protein [Okeania sp. SIO1H6]NEP70563.1 hypothetical protein [Okeania sp. SIO2G5]NEP93248.1 hypothetical protein [Okeania sp. SIO2F5]